MVFLAIAVAFGIDRWARYQVQTAFETINEALESQDEAGKLTATDVHALIGRDPDQPAEPPANLETYCWRGAAQSFSLFVVYDRSGVLKDVSVDVKPPPVLAADSREPLGSDEPE